MPPLSFYHFLFAGRFAATLGKEILRLAVLAQDFACGLPLPTPARENRACRDPGFAHAAKRFKKVARNLLEMDNSLYAQQSNFAKINRLKFSPGFLQVEEKAQT